MNPVPDDFDLSPLIGAELLQVCLGQHQLQLHFEKAGLSAHIEGSGDVSLQTNGTTHQLVCGGWKSSDGLEQLTGQEAVGWARSGANQFTITFTRGAALIFDTENGPYEDFTVLLTRENAENQFWVL